MKNLKYLFLIFNALFTSMQSYSQEWSWGLKATGDTQYPYDYSAEINVDYEGNIIIAGYYQKNFSLGSYSLFTEDGHYSDIFLSRVNKAGEVEWLKHVETGSSYDEGIGLAADDDSNIYLTGSKDARIMVSKYDSFGNLIWNQDFNNEHEGYGRTISVDQFDNVYVAGGIGSAFFLAKLDYDGNTMWKKDISVSSSNGCNVTDIAVDAIGNIYFVGVFSVNMLMLDDFVLEHDGGSGDDTFFGKIDTDGNFIWVKSSSGKTTDNPQIALSSDNSLYLSGALFTGITFDNLSVEGICCQQPKPYIVKYQTNGDIAWAKAGYTTYAERGVTNDIKVDDNGNFYLSGTYYTTSGDGENESYLEGYNSLGEHLWRIEMDMRSSDYSHGIDFDNNGYLYNIGFNYSTNFIDKNQYSTLSTIGVGKLNTVSSTNKRTPRPDSKRLVQVCNIEENISLEAKGENIRWYNDPLLSSLVSAENIYTLTDATTDTLYVTQTINGNESWPKEVIAYFSDLPQEPLIVENDTLKAPNGSNFKYQWLYKGDSLVDGTQSFVLVDSTNNYDLFSVLISELNCFKTLKQIEIINSLDNELSVNDIIFYPNPSSGEVFIQANNRYSSDAFITVYNSAGQRIISESVAFFNSTLIDLSSYPNGLFFFNLSINNDSETFRVLKH
ncbi:MULTISPECIES: T9SS type A sorting domain-containing protein [unclassified Imperialibacter]|uniref:T9SS type A sorting domain-containing protein n=1 Tax=unclassified Imperialibacter TaxID=2629706 RepID=UPI00186A4582|nr:MULTISPECIES: T9SS type A sorting domain-containing protein [unclassified Imperialibacter]